MKWCCDAFRARYELRHERGLIIYVLPPVAGASTEPLFHMGFRALERSRHAQLSEAIKGRMKGCMTLDGGTGIGYCPWCGEALRKFYRKSWEGVLDEKLTEEFNLPVA